MNIFKRKPKKYVFYLIRCNDKNANKKLSLYQSEGWEIAGDIETKYNHSMGSTNVSIPMKKLVK